MSRRAPKFIRFPREWEYQLARMEGASATTYRVALFLLWESWRSDLRRVKLSNAALRDWGVGREAKRRALDKLGRAGLVSVERRARKSPTVTVKFTD